MLPHHVSFSLAFGLALSAVISTALMGCQSSSFSTRRTPSSPVTEIVKLTEEDRDLIETGVRRVLKDPESAMFGRMVAGRMANKPNIIVVCGWVNAKNVYGGYVGYQPFKGLLERQIPFFANTAMGGTDIDTEVAHIMCRDSGLPLQ